MKFVIPESRLENIAMKYLDYAFEGLHEVNSKIFPKFRFWKIGGKVVMQMDTHIRLWVRYDIWDRISDMFSLDYDEAQELIKKWVKLNMGLDEVRPQKKTFRNLTYWDMI